MRYYNRQATLLARGSRLGFSEALGATKYFGWTEGAVVPWKRRWERIKSGTYAPGRLHIIQRVVHECYSLTIVIQRDSAPSYAVLESILDLSLNRSGFGLPTHSNPTGISTYRIPTALKRTVQDLFGPFEAFTLLAPRTINRILDVHPSQHKLSSELAVCLSPQRRVHHHLQDPLKKTSSSGREHRYLPPKILRQPHASSNEAAFHAAVRKQVSDPNTS